MTNTKNELPFGKASLKFFLITIGIVIISLLIGGLILLKNGSFTYWAIVPLLIGFPVTVLINLSIARKTIAQKSKSHTHEGDQQNEQTE